MEGDTAWKEKERANEVKGSGKDNRKVKDKERWRVKTNR